MTLQEVIEVEEKVEELDQENISPELDGSGGEDMELFLIVGDINEPDDHWVIALIKRVFGKQPRGAQVYEAKKPTVGTVRVWMKTVEEMNVKGQSFDDPANFKKLFSIVAGFIDHPDVTADVIENEVILENFLAMFNAGRITAWIQEQTTITQKKMQEIQTIARMKAKKRRHTKR